MSRSLPPSASIANAIDGGKLHAPSASRNVDAISEMVRTNAPASGSALEIASGTGQHITAFANLMPALHWQPSDVVSERLRSIDAYINEAGLKNVAPAVHLDATKTGWAKDHAGKDLILLANLTHLITTPEVRTIISEASQALDPNGTLIIYGPFKRDGALTSDGDLRFDAELRGADPMIGYKDTRDMLGWLQEAGLGATTHEMPANNLAFVARRTTP